MGSVVTGQVRARPEQAAGFARTVTFAAGLTVTSVGQAGPKQKGLQRAFQGRLQTKAGERVLYQTNERVEGKSYKRRTVLLVTHRMSG